jgi:hypothetical protein
MENGSSRAQCANSKAVEIFAPRIPTGFKSISPGLAVRAGQAIRAGWATRAYPGKPFPKFINSEGACARPPFHHATA